MISVLNPQPDEAAKRKKTDEPAPDDPQPSGSMETEGGESSPQPQPGGEDSGEPQSFIAEDNEQVYTKHTSSLASLLYTLSNRVVNVLVYIPTSFSR